MPDRPSLPAGKPHGAAVPVGRYNTARMVQSQSLADRNATAVYLDQFNQDPRGLQEAYANAITDVPHPVTGRPVSYAALKGEFVRNAAPIYQSRAYQQGGYKNSGEYLAAVFEQGRQRLMQQAVRNPQRNVFEGQAQAAAAAVQRENLLREGQVVLPGGSQREVALADMRRRQALLPRGGLQVAPGMSR